MKILVTGGAGFIGSHVVDGYIQAGHEVVIADNLSTGLKENINPQATFEWFDIRPGSWMHTAEEVGDLIARHKPDIVNHHAAQMDVRVSTREPAFDCDTNVLGMVHLLEACVEHGVQKVIFSSTGGAIYGEPSYPIRDEHDPIRPISPYGLSKFAAEEYLRLFHRMHGLDYTIFRYPNVYGPRQRPDGEAGVIAIFTGKLLRGETPIIYGDGQSTRDYVHVADIARANRLALTKGGAGTYNLGSGRETSVIQIFLAIRTILEQRTPVVYADARPGEVSRICLDAKRAFKELGWEAEIPLHQGIRATVEVLQHG